MCNVGSGLWTVDCVVLCCVCLERAVSAADLGSTGASSKTLMFATISQRECDFSEVVLCVCVCVRVRCGLEV
jgi:hypothetical protein